MIVRHIPRHFVAPLSERGGCRVIPAQIVLFVAIADNHKLIIINSLEFIEVALNKRESYFVGEVAKHDFDGVEGVDARAVEDLLAAGGARGSHEGGRRFS